MNIKTILAPHDVSIDDFTPEQRARYGESAISITQQGNTMKRLSIEEQHLDYVIAHAPELIAARFEYEQEEVRLERALRLKQLEAEIAKAEADQREAKRRAEDTATAPTNRAPTATSATSPLDAQLRALRSRS